MVKGILGTKAGMTRIFNESGESIPVTVIEAGPCPIVQIKTKDKEGYASVQLGLGSKRKKLFTKAELGHYTKAKLEPTRYLVEMPVEKVDELKVGQEIRVDIFKAGEKVDVIGTSKGMGFQGGVRRHHFAGGPKTHGQSDRLRAPGSIGASSFPSRTFKGQRMAGRMGGDRVTVKNLVVLEVDAEKNMLVLMGAVPGKSDCLLTVIKTKRR